MQHSEPTPERKNFTQIQNCIIDSDLPETTVLGFIRFMRHCWKEGKFTGSIRKLCNLLKMARSTVARMISEWVKQGWVARTTQPKQDEEGEAMCLILLDEAIWQANHECYGGVPKTSSTVPNLDTTVPKKSKGVPERDHAVPKKSGNGPKTSSTVPSPMLKVGGNIGNIDSNTESNRDRNTGEAPSLPKQQPITEPLPACPLPSSEEKEMTWETITPDTPHCLEAVMAIATHYLGASKVTQTDAEAFLQKTQSLATLTGPHEVRRQLLRNITFLLYSDHASNWFSKGDRRKQLTFGKVVAWYDDHTRKATGAGWEPPLDKLPGWYHADEAVSQQQEGGEEREENYLSGMDEQEAQTLTARIVSEYPGMKITWGNLPQGRFTVGLDMGEGYWLDMYKAWEWAARGDDPRFGYVLEAYEQCALVGVA